MAAIDKISGKYGKNTLRFGVERFRDDWQMRREFMSRRYTTQFNEILQIH
jgi:DNA polymerase V